MPPTETSIEGMLCLSRHDNCPWHEALKSADITWTGLRYACLKILHLYCKVFEKEDILELIIRKTCKSCGCDRLQHSVYHEELGSVRDRLGLRDNRVNHHAYDSPPGLTAKQTDLFWASLAERAPTSGGGATGAAAWRAWRTRALAIQLPKQDLSLAHCRHLDEAHRKQFEDFVAARNEIALDIGIACQHHGASIECYGCNKAIRSGAIAVQAPRIGEEVAYHPACFTCTECGELLVELSYCALDGRPYCVRHYSERLKPRCHACDELFTSCPGVTPPQPAPLPWTRPTRDLRTMGLMLSIVISYAGVNEAIECVKHIIRGVVPDGEPNFEELVEYYTRLLNKAANPSSPSDWIKECGQGYLCLTEDKNGALQSATVKYYGQTRSAAILFSTKISSFGQESVDEGAHVNGDYRTDRYTPTKTKTIISSNTSESFSIGPRNRLSTPQNTLESDNDKNENDNELNDLTADREKLSWHYKPQSPSRKPLPEIHFQSYDADRAEKTSYSEEFLRSLDGIKFRPLQRNDPSGRRRSFRKRHSSSSNSSRDSKASRDEELRMFTSLEEEEFRKMNEGDKSGRFGSTPNLTRSYSRSRSREKSRESERWSTEASLEGIPDEEKAKLKDIPKLDSFAEERGNDKENEVKEETEEEVDFWANLED